MEVARLKESYIMQIKNLTAFNYHFAASDFNC